MTTTAKVSLTLAQRQAVEFRYAAILGEALKTLGEVPSGHLYAKVCGHLTLDDFNKAINHLQFAKLVTVNNYVIKWVK